MGSLNGDIDPPDAHLRLKKRREDIDEVNPSDIPVNALTVHCIIQFS